MADTVKYREYLEQRLARHPELFPAGMAAGFTFHDRYHSVKQKLVLHRIKLNATGAVFQLRPSFVLPVSGGAHPGSRESALPAAVGGAL